MKKILLVAAFLAGLTAFVFAGARAALGNAPAYGDEIIVMFKDKPADNDYQALSKKYGATIKDKQTAASYIPSSYGLTEVRPGRNHVPFNTYRVADISKLEATVKALASDPAVAYCHPNYYIHAYYTPLSAPNDTLYQNGSQWAFQQISADRAYVSGLINPGKSKTVIVAVLDTGIWHDNSGNLQEDLTGKVVPGYNEVSGTADTNDDNTLDDQHNCDLASPAPYHGTHVAGIIAANTGNGKGIAGVGYTYVNTTGTSWAAQVKVMPVKVLNNCGEGTDDNIYAGTVYAVDNGAKILNYSLGEPQDDPTLKSAINYAAGAGCICVAAAGNAGTNALSYPAAYSNVVSVSSLNQNDSLSDFSSWGKVDVSAPGGNGTPFEGIESCTGGSLSNYDADFAGTSFASPYAAGVLAMILLKNDNISPEKAVDTLEHTADTLGGGFNNQTGWGRVNLYNALTNSMQPAAAGIKVYNWPNPFSPQKDLFTNIAIASPGSAAIALSIYDGGGQLVWKYTLPAYSALQGYNTIRWDGKTSGGLNVANGVYFCIVKINNSTGKCKIAVLY